MGAASFSWLVFFPSSFAAGLAIRVAGKGQESVCLHAFVLVHHRDMTVQVKSVEVR